MIKLFNVVMCAPRRLTYATGTPKGPGSAETGEEITLANLRDKLLEMEGGKLNDKQADSVYFVLNKGTNEDKELVLKLVRKMVADDKDGKWLVSRLPKVAKGATPEAGAEENAEPTEKTETSKEKPEAKEAAEGGAETAEPEKEIKDINDIQMKIGSQVDHLLTQAESINENMEAKPESAPEDIRARIKQLLADMRNLDQIDDANEKPLLDKVKELVNQKKLDINEGQKLINLDPKKQSFQSKWDRLAAKLSKEESESLQKLFKETEAKSEKVSQDNKKRLAEAVEILNKQTEVIMTKGEQQEALERLQNSVGFPLKPGTRLRYLYLKNADGTPTFRKVVIKDVSFKDIEIRDEDGKVKKASSTSPSVTIEWEQQDGRDKGELTFTAAAFKRNVDIQDICPLVEGLAEEDLTADLKGQNVSLESLIGEKIKAGDIFEFREQTVAIDNSRIGIDKKVKVESIDNTKKTITLDQEVVTAELPEPRREKTLSFDGFAKWFKRAEAVRPIGSLKELREKLKNMQQERNNSYHDPETGGPRSEKTFPPIEVKPGEKLKYDTETPVFFEIKDADDKGITLSDGTKFTPGSFYNWVKNHEVEKVTPENTTPENEAAGVPPGQEPPEGAGENGEGAEGQEMTRDEIYDKAAEAKPKKSQSWRSHVWENTLWVSFSDLGELLARYKKFIIGKKVRKLKTKQFKLGKMVGDASDFIFRPLGNKPTASKEWKANFESDIHNLEIEKVNKVKAFLKDYGVFELKQNLYDSFSKDWIRAIMEVLSEKGEIRWDDKRMWEAISKQKDAGGYVIRDQETLKFVMDKMWQEGFYDGMRNRNDSAYNSNRTNFTDLAKRITSDPNNNGGLKGALQQILYKHLQGQYVNPAEYEAYLSYAIEAGKLTFDDKLYFLVMGLGARGKKPDIKNWKLDKGMTLLSLDRYSKLEDQYLNAYPIVQFFLTPVKRKDEDGNLMSTAEFNPKTGKYRVGQSEGPYSVGNYMDLIKDRVISDLNDIHAPEDCNPTDSFRDFIDKTMVWDPTYKIRVAEKASKNASQWDHDDMHMFGPMLSEEGVRQLTAIQGGGEQKTSLAAQKNAYAGYNNFTHTLIEMMKDDVNKKDEVGAQTNAKRMVHFLRSFIRYDGFLSRKLEPNNSNISRLGDAELRDYAGVDNSRHVYYHVQEMRDFIEQLCNVLGKEKEWQGVIEENDPNDNTAVTKQSNLILQFGGNLERAIGNYIDQHGALAFAKVVEDIQAKSGDRAVRGIESKPKDKKKLEALGKEEIQLEKETGESFIKKVNQLKELRSGKGVKSNAQIKKEDAARLDEVIELVDHKRFNQLTSADGKILDSAIEQLRGSLAQGEVADEGAAGGEGAQGGGRGAGRGRAGGRGGAHGGGRGGPHGGGRTGGRGTRGGA